MAILNSLSAGAFFKSFYYEKTYLSPINFNDEISKHLLEKEDKETADRATSLISTPAVQKILSEPLSYDPPIIQANNRILESHNFKLLSVKYNNGQLNPFYSVVEHNDLPGWVIKSGAARVPKDKFILGLGNDKGEMTFCTEEDSLLRIPMVERINKIALESGIHIVTPKKKLVAYANAQGMSDIKKKYCVICEKINVLSKSDTLEAIKNMDEAHQREIALKIILIVKKAGLPDASFHNIRLTPEGEVAILDTEPLGLMVIDQPGSDKKKVSVEMCGRIGLWTLINQVSSQVGDTLYRQVDPGMNIFYKEVFKAYQESTSPPLSTWKIVISIASLGVLPLIIGIVSIIKAILLVVVIIQVNELNKKTMPAEQLSYNYQSKLAPLVWEYHERRSDVL